MYSFACAEMLIDLTTFYGCIVLHYDTYNVFHTCTIRENRSFDLKDIAIGFRSFTYKLLIFWLIQSNKHARQWDIGLYWFRINLYPPVVETWWDHLLSQEM